MFPKRRKASLWKGPKFSSGAKIRPWQRNSKRNKKRGKAILALIVFSAGYFLFFSPFFLIKEISVSGNEMTSTDGIKNAVYSEINTPVLEFLPGNNLLFGRNDKIKANLLAKFPQIESVKVIRKLPDKMTLEIKEKNPVLLWCRTNSCYYLDEKGTAMLAEDKLPENMKSRKFIKVIEQPVIEEEVEENAKVQTGQQAEEKEYNATPDSGTIAENNNLDKNIASLANQEIKEPEAKVQISYSSARSFGPIEENLSVSDKEFVDFAVALDKELQSTTKINVKYYKTKGTVGRELIAYSDKNIRFYFDTTGNAALQVKYLNNFLSSGIEKDKISTLRYIYLRSDNKVYYK